MIIKKIVVNLLLTTVAILMLPLYIVGTLALSIGFMIIGVFCAFSRVVEIIKDIWTNNFQLKEFLGEE